MKKRLTTQVNKKMPFWSKEKKRAFVKVLLQINKYKEVLIRLANT